MPAITFNGHGIGDASYNTYVFARVGMDITTLTPSVLGKS
jgi:hypothetical protein